MNPQEHEADNPFAVLSMQGTEQSVPAVDFPISEHSDYEVVDRGILCRSGLRLPEWCLHTGRESKLEPMVLNVVDWGAVRSSSAGRVFRGVLVGLFLVLGTLLLTVGISALTGLRGLIVFPVSLLLVGVASLVLWTTYRSSKTQSAMPVCCLTGFVGRLRQRMAVVVGILPSVLIFGSFFTPLVAQRFYLVLSFWGTLWLLQTILGRVFWSGTRLKCRQLPDGRFLVTGFSAGYWRRLEAQRRDVR